MKKLFFIFFSFVLFVILSASLILFPNNTAYAENTESDEENSEETIEETVQEIIDETDLSEYEDFVNNLKLPDDYTLSGLLDSVLNNNYELDFNYLTSYILKCFLGNIKGLIIQSLIILITVVLMSILNNLTSGFSKTSTKKIVYLACYGTIIVIVGIMVGSAIESSGKMISDVEKFSNVSFPALLTLVTAIGANASAAVYQPLVLIFSSLMIKIINYIVMPAFFISFVFNIIGNLSDDLKLSKISGFAKSAGEWIIGISFGLFITYTTAQGITGAGIDSLATKGAKYALGSYIPVIGGYLKDGFDFVFVHVEAPDECGHRHEPENKVKAIEIIDREVLPIVLEELEKYDDYKIMILPDHPTPIVTMTHARDPVPFMIYHKNDEKNGVETVTEATAKSTGVYFESGEKLMKYFLDKE